jgi:hypothetical protein
MSYSLCSSLSSKKIAKSLIVKLVSDEPNTVSCKCKFCGRDLVMSTKGPDTPIVIVGNKTDLDRVVSKVIMLFTKSDNIKKI